ncbi:MAG: hypothetical protein O3B64_01220 [bacterium]|nr:hypothetical protein [bacterium]
MRQEFIEKPKRFQRRMQKHATNANDLAHAFLKRHGIKEQVESSQLVKLASTWLYDHVDQGLRADMRVISYQSGILTVAGRHAGAMHYLESIRASLYDNLVQQAPESGLVSVRIRHMIPGEENGILPA